MPKSFMGSLLDEDYQNYLEEQDKLENELAKNWSKHRKKAEDHAAEAENIIESNPEKATAHATLAIYYYLMSKKG